VHPGLLDFRLAPQLVIGGLDALPAPNSESLSTWRFRFIVDQN